MNISTIIFAKARQTIGIYWVLARVTIPVAIVTEILARLGVIKVIAPVFAPVMNVVGLPSELGLAWLTALLVGIWGAIPLIFSLVEPSSLSVADITVFSSLVLFAHGLPIEQKIIQQAGPRLVATTLVRLAGGLLYASLLHQVLSVTGSLQQTVDPVWIPLSAAPDWLAFGRGLAESMAWMFVVLLVLSIGLELLKITGILALIMTALAPALRLAGIRKEAGHLTAVGLFLGISYGAGLLIQEARSDTVSPRQVFLSCVFMGFAHSIIEDSLLMMSLGADAYAIVLGRLVFAILASAVLAALLYRISEKTFLAFFFAIPGDKPEVHSPAVNGGLEENRP